jgi:hypothetical protein
VLRSLLLATLLGASPWVTRAPGPAELALVATPTQGDGVLHVVRIDPRLAELRFVFAAEENRPAQPASDWTDQRHLEAAINAGMYLPDFKTTTGYCRDGATVVNPKWNGHQSAFAFGPKDPKLPSAILVDLDQTGSREQLAQYRSVVQNLSLIKGNGVNVWPQKARAWSEAAVAMDKRWRVLFLFSRTPLSMKDFNDRLLALPLAIVRAMHVEGGPEASLSIRAGNLHVDLMGSFETGFQENDDNQRQWPIPNVIGVVPKR